MNRNFYLSIALLFLSCTQADNKSAQSNWDKPTLEGHWRLCNVEIVDEVPFLNLQAPEPDLSKMVYESSPWDFYTEYDLVFESDSMYKVNYPIETFPPTYYFLDTGYIHVGPKDDICAYPAELVNDTLLFYNPLTSEPGYFKEYYVRTNFNDSVFNILKKHRINYPALTGNWMLVSEEDYNYGTHYELNFPHTIPDSIKFSRKQMIAALEDDKVYMMSTDGIQRDYSFFYRSPQLCLKPREWYKESGDTLIYFERK